MVVVRGMSIALSESSSPVWASDATPYRDYFCARCSTLLAFDPTSNSFIHPLSNICSEKQSMQKLAVLYLRQLLSELDSGPLQLLIRCASCPDFAAIDLRNHFQRSSLFADEAGREGLLIEGAVNLLFLIRPASPALIERSHSWDAWWCELDSRDIIAGSPWRALTSNLPDHKCSCCDPVHASAIESIYSIADEAGIKYDTTAYKSRATVCASCKQQTLLFRWGAQPDCQFEEPPHPIPFTVQRTWSKRVGRYLWTSICCWCGEAQDGCADRDAIGGWY